MTFNRLWVGAVVLAGIAALAPTMLTSEVRGQSSSTAPQYTADGQLKVPVGFETWVFAGSNLGLAYKEELPANTKLESLRATQQQSTTSTSTPRRMRIFSPTRNSRTRPFW